MKQTAQVRSSGVDGGQTGVPGVAETEPGASRVEDVALHVCLDQSGGGEFAVEKTVRVDEEVLLVLVQTDLWGGEGRVRSTGHCECLRGSMQGERNVNSAAHLHGEILFPTKLSVRTEHVCVHYARYKFSLCTMHTMHTRRYDANSFYPTTKTKPLA